MLVTPFSMITDVMLELYEEYQGALEEYVQFFIAPLPLIVSVYIPSLFWSLYR